MLKNYQKPFQIVDNMLFWTTPIYHNKLLSESYLGYKSLNLICLLFFKGSSFIILVYSLTNSHVW